MNPFWFVLPRAISKAANLSRLWPLPRNDGSDMPNQTSRRNGWIAVKPKFAMMFAPLNLRENMQK